MAVKDPSPPNLEEPESASKERNAEMREGKGGPKAPRVKSVSDRAQVMLGATGGHLPEGGKIPGDAQYGQFVTVTKGEHKGAYGVFTDVSTRDEDGYPDLVIVRRRNSGQLISVPYADLEPAAAGDIERDRY